MKAIHIEKNGLQLIDYIKLFDKKLYLNEIDIHGEIDQKLKNLNNYNNNNNNSNNFLIFQNDIIVIYGGFEGSNIMCATMIESNEVNINKYSFRLIYY